MPIKFAQATHGNLNTTNMEWNFRWRAKNMDGWILGGMSKIHHVCRSSIFCTPPAGTWQNDFVSQIYEIWISRFQKNQRQKFHESLFFMVRLMMVGVAVAVIAVLWQVQSETPAYTLVGRDAQLKAALARGDDPNKGYTRGDDPNKGYARGFGLLYSQSPLFHAISHAESVKALLDAGADPNVGGTVGPFGWIVVPPRND